MRNYLPRIIIVLSATFVWYAMTHENNVVVNFLISVFICYLFAYFFYSDLTKKKAWAEDYKTITVFEAVEIEPLIIEISDEEEADHKAIRASYRELTRHNNLRQKVENPELEKVEGLQDWIIASVQNTVTPPQGFEEVITENGQSYYRKRIKRDNSKPLTFQLGDISENRF